MNGINEFQEQVKQQKLDTKQYDVIYMKFMSRQNYSMAMESSRCGWGGEGLSGKECEEFSVS